MRIPLHRIRAAARIHLFIFCFDIFCGRVQYHLQLVFPLSNHVKHIYFMAYMHVKNRLHNLPVHIDVRQRIDTFKHQQQTVSLKLLLFQHKTLPVHKIIVRQLYRRKLIFPVIRIRHHTVFHIGAKNRAGHLCFHILLRYVIDILSQHLKLPDSV